MESSGCALLILFHDLCGQLLKTREIAKSVQIGVNGQEFDSFKQFVKLIEDTQEENIVFESEDRDMIILLCKDIDKITQDIVSRNNISSQFSDDVAQWKKLRN